MPYEIKFFLQYTVKDSGTGVHKLWVTHRQPNPRGYNILLAAALNEMKKTSKFSIIWSKMAEALIKRKIIHLIYNIRVIIFCITNIEGLLCLLIDFQIQKTCLLLIFQYATSHKAGKNPCNKSSDDVPSTAPGIIH